MNELIGNAFWIIMILIAASGWYAFVALPPNEKPTLDYDDPYRPPDE